MVPAPGTQLGIYRLTRRLGAGGMGEVWKAEDTRLHRDVAIKLLAASMTGDEESRARMLREARTAGQLYHPNIATIHGIELDGETPYIVMEYVEGESLASAIAARTLSATQVAEIGRAIADALAEAHARGIVHRDIKPDNVVLARTRVKVLDFGIAKRYGEAADAPPGEFVTAAGVVLGTVSYMSPEQATGRPLDGRSDIFSLGVMLYQALAGQPPFRGKGNLEILRQILRSEPPELRTLAPHVSPELASIVARCLRKLPEERYQTAAELADELARVALHGLAAPSAAEVPRRPVDHAAATVIQPFPRAAGETPAAPPASPAETRPRGGAPVTSAHTHWIIAGASFIVVLAIAGGFVVARLFGAKPASRAVTRTVAPAVQPASTTATQTSVASKGPSLRFQEPSPATPPGKRQAIVSPRPPAAREAGPATGAASEVRSSTPHASAIAALERGAWRYLDDEGWLSEGATAAEPHFRQALAATPGDPSTQLNLALISLFRRRYDSAQKAIHPLLADQRLSHAEIALASFAFSASTVAPTGNGVEQFEAALDDALRYYGNDPRFVAFARDVRWLARRGKGR